MRKIIQILAKEGRTDKEANPYYITHVLTDAGDEAQYFGTDIREGDEVEVWFDETYNKIKCRKPGDPKQRR